MLISQQFSVVDSRGVLSFSELYTTLVITLLKHSVYTTDKFAEQTRHMHRQKGFTYIANLLIDNLPTFFIVKYPVCYLVVISSLILLCFYVSLFHSVHGCHYACNRLNWHASFP